MKNWTVGLKHLSKHAEQYKAWRLEQLINFGLDGEKLRWNDVRNYMNRLEIDPAKKRYLQFLLDKNQI